MICDKVPYRTRAEAIAAIRGLKKAKGVNRSKRQAGASYYCHACAAYHLYTRGPKKRILRVTPPAGASGSARPRKYSNLVIHHRMRIK